MNLDRFEYGLPDQQEQPVVHRCTYCLEIIPVGDRGYRDTEHHEIEAHDTCIEERYDIDLWLIQAWWESIIVGDE